MLFGCYGIYYLDTLKPQYRLELDSIYINNLRSYRLILIFDLKVRELYVIETSFLAI